MGEPFARIRQSAFVLRCYGRHDGIALLHSVSHADVGHVMFATAHTHWLLQACTCTFVLAVGHVSCAFAVLAGATC